MIVSVVPDVSGIDKVFDYLVPDHLIDAAQVGSRVRVVLNGRRVAGWIVGRHESDDDHDAGNTGATRELSLHPIESVSGPSVEPEMVALTRWVATRHFGSWRAVLAQAASPRVRHKVVHERHGSNQAVQDQEVVTALGGLPDGGLVVVPPGGSSLAVVAELARLGPTLVVCPTQKMAALGAAWLRGRQLTTAVVPQDWESARAGVDVVIGARSAVFAPCAGLRSICVIDEHDEALRSERAPTWNAVGVARARASRAGARCVLTSPVPSAEAVESHRDHRAVLGTEHGWPRITVVDLAGVPVAGSLLSSPMLAALANRVGSGACVLNTKGNARLLLCKSCRETQKCPDCSSLLTRDEHERLLCERCATNHGSVCLACGRTSFVIPRGGVGQLVKQLRASVGGDIVEVVGDGKDDWIAGSVFVGTEAVLHRVPRVDVVVFADIDRDLSAPRLTAPREVLALVARAARMVGVRGEVVIQTRDPEHPVLSALTSDDVTSALLAWNELDIAQRRMLGFPPFSTMVRLSVKESSGSPPWPTMDGVDVAHFDDHVMIKSPSFEELQRAIEMCRMVFGAALRVHADPLRY